MKTENETKLSDKSIEKPCVNNPAVSATRPVDNPVANPPCMDSTCKIKIHEYIVIQLKHTAATPLQN